MADDKKKEEKKEEQPAAAAPPPAKSKKMLFIVIGGVAVLGLAIGIPVAMMAMKGGGEKTIEELPADAAKLADDSVPEGHADEDELEEGEEAMGALFPMETFVVNLEGGKYIRCQVQVEFNERDIPKRFYNKLVPVRDSIIALLSNRSADDVAGGKGKEALKGDIKDAINELLRKQEVKNIYFTQFVVQ